MAASSSSHCSDCKVSPCTCSRTPSPCTCSGTSCCHRTPVTTCPCSTSTCCHRPMTLVEYSITGTGHFVHFDETSVSAKSPLPPPVEIVVLTARTMLPKLPIQMFAGNYPCTFGEEPTVPSTKASLGAPMVSSGASIQVELPKGSSYRINAPGCPDSETRAGAVVSLTKYSISREGRIWIAGLEFETDGSLSSEMQPLPALPTNVPPTPPPKLPILCDPIAPIRGMIVEKGNTVLARDVQYSATPNDTPVYVYQGTVVRVYNPTDGREIWVVVGGGEHHGLKCVELQRDCLIRKAHPALEPANKLEFPEHFAPLGGTSFKLPAGTAVRIFGSNVTGSFPVAVDFRF